MSGSLQLFCWAGEGQVKDKKIYYQGFSLDGQTYNVGDCVFLFPEYEHFPPYIARILAAWVDQNVEPEALPEVTHCIEVKWFERRVNLEPSTRGIEESEREVFELEDTDVNPIGCISGKCRIIRAQNYEEACSRCGNAAGWFFCRGYFHQSTNSFVAYTPSEMAAGEAEGAAAALPPPGPQQPQQQQRGAGLLGEGARGEADHLPLQQLRAPGGLPGSGAQALDPRGRPAGEGPSHPGGPHPGFPNGLKEVAAAGSEAEELVQAGRVLQHNPPPAQQQPASKRQKATGRTCMSCGVTSTPQWREGPMGPKTLCNACGVRYVRSQQRAAGQKRSGGGPKNGQGRLQEPTPPRAQQQADRVTKRGTKAYRNEPPTDPSDGEAGAMS
ncbi:hypothetical protein Agub_g11928 [Astrephomene gubernaculifera]|uniref:GATA-type domain-containing protein n=1 Tax=Astrephomene gubernaculifera TaxID=47775 RepID=A0AAD3DXB4_9CHLO|nr:hypothetical protein Agub_g11928 [Astrephomene gubernaculifera]